METNIVLPLSQPYNKSDFVIKRDWKSKEFRNDILLALTFVAGSILIKLVGVWLNIPEFGDETHRMSITDVLSFAAIFVGTKSVIEAFKNVFTRAEKAVERKRNSYFYYVILPAAHTQQDMADWHEMYFLGLLDTGKSGMWIRVDDEYALSYDYHFTKDGEGLVVNRTLVENNSWGGNKPAQGDTEKLVLTKN